MRTLKEYLNHKNILRHIQNNVDGLELIYRFMKDDEKELLKSHKETISFNNDVRDCAKIKERYSLSWNEIRYIISRLA